VTERTVAARSVRLFSESCSPTCIWRPNQPLTKALMSSGGTAIAYEPVATAYAQGAPVAAW